MKETSYNIIMEHITTIDATVVTLQVLYKILVTFGPFMVLAGGVLWVAERATR